MADYDWPTDLVPYSVEFYLRPHVGRSVSPFNRAMKVYGLSAPQWVSRLRFRGGDSTRWGTSGPAIYGPRLDALIARLEGGAHRVSLWDFRRPGAAPDGWSNAAVTAGTDQITLLGTNDALSHGDYVGGDGRPHIVTDTEVSGSDLIATVRPHFQTDIAASSAVFERVPGMFRLISDDAGANVSEVGQLTLYDLEFIEDFGPATDVLYDGDPVTYSG